MESAITEYVARPKRYANIDGTGELYLGIMMLGFALLMYLQPVLPKSSILGHGLGVLAFMYLLLLLVGGLDYWFIRAIRTRITYPRTGYFAYRPNPWTFVYGFGFGAALAFVLDFARHHDAMDAYRLLNAAILVGPYALFIRFGREHRWKWLVVVFMAIGLLAISVLVPGGLREWFLPVSLLLGLSWLVSGAITLSLYLRHSQAPEGE